MATTYCTVEDVERILGVGIGYFTDSTNPQRDDVEEIINQNEDFIDNWCHRAWRERKALNGEYEYHTLGRLGIRGSWFVWLGYPVYLKYRNVRKLSPEEGDALEVYNGSEWEDWLATKEEGEGKDFWVDYDNGIAYFRGLFVYLALKEYVMRIKYRYGATVVPRDIRMACALLTASQLVESSDRSFLLPEGGTQVVSAPEKSDRWRQRALQILDMYRDFVAGGG